MVFTAGQQGQYLSVCNMYHAYNLLSVYFACSQGGFHLHISSVMTGTIQTNTRSINSQLVPRAHQASLTFASTQATVFLDVRGFYLAYVLPTQFFSFTPQSPCVPTTPLFFFKHTSWTQNTWSPIPITCVSSLGGFSSLVCV